MIIERFEKQYIADVTEIERRCFSSPWSEEQLAEELENPCARFFVAVENGRAVGYAGLYVVCGEGDVARVAVLPEYRKSGIAKAILQQAFTDDITEIFLDVRESNIPAIKLYHSLGFADIGIRKNYYTNPTENAILMKRTD